MIALDDARRAGDNRGFRPWPSLRTVRSTSIGCGDGALVLQNADQRVEAHRAQRDLSLRRRAAVSDATRPPPGGAPDRCAAACCRRSCDARDAVRQIAEIDGDTAQLVRRALELAQCRGLILRRRRHVLRTGAVASRDLGDAHHAVAQP